MGLWCNKTKLWSPKDFTTPAKIQNPMMYDISSLGKLSCKNWTLSVSKTPSEVRKVFDFPPSVYRLSASHIYHYRLDLSNQQGIFFTGPPPKKLKCGKPRLGEVSCILDVLDTPNLA